jgi:N-acetylneuraminic acid mutarotase
MSYFKDIAKVKKRLASIQKVFYSYLDSKPDYDAKLMWAPYIKRPTVGDKLQQSYSQSISALH